MTHDERQYQLRLMDWSEELLDIAKTFINLYGAGGPESAFDALEERAMRAIDAVEGDDEVLREEDADPCRGE